MQQKSFREKFFNKRTLLILVIAALIIGAGSGAALIKASDNPKFCNTCHLMKPYYESWSNPELMLSASKHAAEDVDCHQCHEPDLATQINKGFKFITRTYQVPLEKREFEQEFCYECHSEEGGATTWEEAKLATEFEDSNPHDSHHGNLECYICHNMHQKSKPYCADCHIFDWIDELDDGWIKYEGISE